MKKVVRGFMDTYYIPTKIDFTILYMCVILYVGQTFKKGGMQLQWDILDGTNGYFQLNTEYIERIYSGF